MRRNGKLFGVFNSVDIILICLILVAAFVGFRLFSGGGNDSDSTEKTYQYVVEGAEVLNETADFPVVEGKAFNSSTSAYLGIVKEVTTEPARETIFNRDAGAYQKIPIDGYSNIRLTIEGKGIETDKDITVEGTVVKVGMELNVKGKGYAFKGIVMEVRDGE